MPSVLLAKLPSGKQLEDYKLPPQLESEIRTLTVDVLRQRMLPILQRRRARATRTLLTRQQVEHYTEAGIRTAGVQALTYASYLTHHLPGLAADVTRVVAAAPNAFSSSPTHKPVAKIGSSDSSDSDRDEGSAEPRPTTAPVAAGGEDGEAEQRPSLSSQHTAEDKPQGSGNEAEENGSAGVHTPPPEQKDEEEAAAGERRPTVTHHSVRDAIVTAVDGARTQVYLQGERLQWVREPAREVMILIAGSVSRRVPVLPDLSSGQFPSTRTSTAGLFGGRRVSSSAAVTTSAQGRRVSLALDNLLAKTGSPITRLAAARRRGATQEFVEEEVAAPLVLGEAACLGSFPYSEDVVVSSVSALVLHISLQDYMEIVTTAKTEVQRALVVNALRFRQYNMPCYAPLTRGRLRLCPLLTTLRNEDLDVLLEHVRPCVYAAGMLCNSNPQQDYGLEFSGDYRFIYFIRRGVVRVQREGFSQGEAGSPFSPKNRSVLVDGHTFGEMLCIFGDATDEHYYAVTHTDAYLLPFQVVIQLMKSQHEVQQAVYKGARALSGLQDLEAVGVRFCPEDGSLRQQQIGGVVPRQSAAWGAASRRSTFLPGGSTSVSGDVTLAGTERPAAPPPRRVTIFEEDAATLQNDGVQWVGGRVSQGMQSDMQNMPLFRLFASEDFRQECARLWRCFRVPRGEYIVRRGEECNRLLFFYEGRAAIVADEQLFATSKNTVLGSSAGGTLCRGQSSAFSSEASLEVLSAGGAAAAGLTVIPAGHMVGYTCTLRHRWARSIVSLDDQTEVWEIKRSHLVTLLRKCGLERVANTAALQLLQPLYSSPKEDRFVALDYQPLLRPLPNSLWGEGTIPNLHPVSEVEKRAIFSVWKEGDFPLDSVSNNSSRNNVTPGGATPPLAKKDI